MKTLTSFFNGKTEKTNINIFEKSLLSSNEMGMIRGGDGDGYPGGDAGDIWIPDDDQNAQ